MERLFLVGVLVFMGAGWGLTIPLTKIAVSAGYQQFGLIFWQLVFSSVFLAIISIYNGMPPKLRASHWFLFLVIAFTGTLIPGAFSLIAAYHLPAGVLAITISLVPMFSLPIAVMLRLDKFSVSRVLGVFLGLCAILALIGPSTSLPDHSKAIYVLFSLVAVFSYAVEGNFVAKFGLRGLDPVQTLLGASLLGIVLVSPVTHVTGQWIDLRIAWGAPEWSILAISLLHGSAYSGYVWLVTRAGSVFAAQVAYLVTAFGVIWSILLLAEVYSGWVWAAMVLMMLGLALVQPRKREIAELQEPLEPSANMRQG